MGFGRYFKMLITDENVSFSLFSFALGVEFAQIIIVFNVLVISLIVINILDYIDSYFIDYVFLVAILIIFP